MSWRCALLAAAGVLVGASLARADLRPPGPAPKTSPLTVRLNEYAKQPTLIVPRTAGGPRGRGALDGVDDEGGIGDARPRLHLVAAGLALALGLTCGGLWLVRKARGPGGKALMLLAGAGVLTAVASLTANPPPPPRPPEDPRPSLYKGQVQVEVDPRANGYELVVTKEMLDALLKAAKKNDGGAIPPAAKPE